MNIEKGIVTKKEYGDKMRIISIFNNKGGVGKTTLTFHLACALSEMGHKTLIIDLDPQCSLTIHALNEEDLHRIWAEEDVFIDDFKSARDKLNKDDFQKISSSTRSIHYLLKPTEDGTNEIGYSRPFKIDDNLDLIPGRLSMHLFENKIASRWSEAYHGDPLAVRTITKIRKLAEDYARAYNYDYIIMDTSPSLGMLNKVIISTTDGFLIPCMPDMFSLYGIKNIGKSLALWKKEFDTIMGLISDEKRKYFPREFVRFLGFTIYNARKYSTNNNRWDLAQAHFNYAKEIPNTIRNYITVEVRKYISDDILETPIGSTSVMHSHSTMPSMGQKYKKPMWLVPTLDNLENQDKGTIAGNRAIYENTKTSYIAFAEDVISRLTTLR